MRTILMTGALVFALTAGLVFPALAQGSAAKESASAATKPRSPRSSAGAKPARSTAGQAQPAQSTGAPARRAHRRPKATRGVPKGVQACIARLIEIASADPLPPYGGQAEEIVNKGLLWNDPKSRCSIGTDQGLRMKISELVKAWRMKDAATVRSLLQEIKSAAPQS